MATASVSTLTVDAAGCYGKSIHTYQPAKFLIPEDSYIDIQKHMVNMYIYVYICIRIPKPPTKNNYSSFSHQKYYKILYTSACFHHGSRNFCCHPALSEPQCSSFFSCLSLSTGYHQVFLTVVLLRENNFDTVLWYTQ